MHGNKAFLAAMTLLVVGLAGCMGGNELDMVITPSDDPVNQPFVFEAKGKADRFVWDFNDGTGPHEGRVLEHTFGFTDGRVTVRLTAEREGQPSETLPRTVTLGSGQNSPPAPVMLASSNWVAPGQAIVLDGSSSTDDDGDPLLYGWTCRRLGDPTPFIDDGHDHSGGGVPFGVTVLASVQPGLVATGSPEEGDLCDAMGSEPGFSRSAAQIAGSFDQTGVYELRMHLRDPKATTAFIGQLTLFVTNGIPAPTYNETFSGTLVAGSQCALQDSIGSTLGETLDCETWQFQVTLPNVNGTLRFSFESSAPGADVEYAIVQGNTPVVPANSDAVREVRADAFRMGPTYTVQVSLIQGASVDYELEIELEYNMNPYYMWEPPFV